MQEASGSFGPRIAQRVPQLEASYGNIVVYASKSGKLSADLIRQWTDDVLEHAVRTEVGTFNREESQVLLLVDSWGRHKSGFAGDALNNLGVELMTIPPKTTSEIQPCDKKYMRQYKQLARRIRQAASLADMAATVSNRDGVLNMQSSIDNQLSSPSYHDMIEWAWHSTDTNFEKSELIRYPPLNVNGIHFTHGLGRGCQIGNCTNDGFIRCAYCGKVLCVHHFLNRECFHDPNSTDYPDPPTVGDFDLLDSEDDNDALFLYRNESLDQSFVDSMYEDGLVDETCDPL